MALSATANLRRGLLSIYPLSFDPSAQAFFTAAGITDATQKSAVNQLVLDLKAASIWGDMSALYPFVGGAATPHSFNLKNPALYQITWFGSVTHNANGITGDGATGYGNTGLPIATLGHLSAIGFYQRTVDTKVSGFARFIGASSAGNAECYWIDHFADTNLSRAFSGIVTDNVSATASQYLGLNTASRASTTSFDLYQGAVSVVSSATLSAVTPAAATAFTLCALNNDGEIISHADSNLALTFLSQGLSSVKVTALNTAVQTFQTTLGRNV